MHLDKGIESILSHDAITCILNKDLIVTRRFELDIFPARFKQRLNCDVALRATHSLLVVATHLIYMVMMLLNVFQKQYTLELYKQYTFF